MPTILSNSGFHTEISFLAALRGEYSLESSWKEAFHCCFPASFCQNKSQFHQINTNSLKSDPIVGLWLGNIWMGNSNNPIIFAQNSILIDLQKSKFYKRRIAFSIVNHSPRLASAETSKRDPGNALQWSHRAFKIGMPTLWLMCWIKKINNIWHDSIWARKHGFCVGMICRQKGERFRS